MPQVDLSSVCAGAGGIAPDRKVACETTAASITSDADDPPPPAPPIDYAPESFFLSRDAELEWLDQNAYIERKNSGKGPTSANLNPNPNPNSNSNSNPNSIYGLQRHLKSKASILGLPMPQKPNYTEAKNRRPLRPASIRLFPKRSESIGRKPAATLSEPSSPKVSCMGRVRSRRDRRKQTESMGTKSVKTTKVGFWNNFRSMFQSRGDKIGCKGAEPDGEPVVPGPRRGSNSRRKYGGSSSESTPGEPPGLGAMNRFASGRKSDAWADEIEVKSEPLDRTPIWRRREKGAPSDVVVDRDWQSVGPASV